MRVRNLALSILPVLALAAASPAVAAGPMVAGPVWAGVDYSIACKIFNTSTKPLEVTIDLVGAESNTVLATSGAVTLNPGGYTTVFDSGVSAQVLCRFTGASAKKASAVLGMYHSTSGDGTDTVVVPAR